MSYYLLLKTIHISCVTLSFIVFFIRGIWMLQDATCLQQPWVKILPHIIDSLLLLSAVGLALVSQQYPHEQMWLAAKITALCGYILLGMIALKWGKTKPIRFFAWLLGLCVYVYIVAVAHTHLVVPF
jgi:uncharacterized membrane protein SirB2